MGYSVFGLEASATADAEVLLIGLVVDGVSWWLNTELSSNISSSLILELM